MRTLMPQVRFTVQERGRLPVWSRIKQLNALHPHRDDYPELTESNDSEGTYHSPTLSDQTRVLDESVEEKATEDVETNDGQDALKNTLPVGSVHRLPRPSVVTPQPRPGRSIGKKKKRTQRWKKIVLMRTVSACKTPGICSVLDDMLSSELSLGLECLGL
eukprot:5550583-Amphidinium_carterae.1